MNDRRRVPRYIAEFSGQVSQPPGTPPCTVSVVNISVSGCSVEGAGSLKTGQACEITFEWKGSQFRADTRVTWKSSKGEAGLQFLDVPLTQLEILKKICANLHLQPLVHREEE